MWSSLQLRSILSRVLLHSLTSIASLNSPDQSSETRNLILHGWQTWIYGHCRRILHIPSTIHIWLWKLFDSKINFSPSSIRSIVQNHFESWIALSDLNRKNSNRYRRLYTIFNEKINSSSEIKRDYPTSKHVSPTYFTGKHNRHTYISRAQPSRLEIPGRRLRHSLVPTLKGSTWRTERSLSRRLPYILWTVTQGWWLNIVYTKIHDSGMIAIE